MTLMARCLVVLAVMLSAAMAQAGSGDAEESTWEEQVVALPAFPLEADLIEFYVSAATANRFFVDSKSLSVGGDGVVRYALVILAGGGARSVSFEGIRCAARAYKIYASGRGDRSWGALRAGEWRPIENKIVNRQHAALFRDYFCPGGVPIFTADEGREALRRGQHPQVN